MVYFYRNNSTILIRLRSRKFEIIVNFRRLCFFREQPISPQSILIIRNHPKLLVSSVIFSRYLTIHLLFFDSSELPLIYINRCVMFEGELLLSLYVEWKLGDSSDINFVFKKKKHSKRCYFLLRCFHNSYFIFIPNYIINESYS